MTSGWNGRFDVAKKDGAKVSYTFEDGLLYFQRPFLHMRQRRFDGESRYRLSVSMCQFVDPFANAVAN
jgi:hypothetical protein